jgi:hypothetical protein
MLNGLVIQSEAKDPMQAHTTIGLKRNFRHGSRRSSAHRNL